MAATAAGIIGTDTSHVVVFTQMLNDAIEPGCILMGNREQNWNPG